MTSLLSVRFSHSTFGAFCRCWSWCSWETPPQHECNAQHMWSVSSFSNIHKQQHRTKSLVHMRGSELAECLWAEEVEFILKPELLLDFPHVVPLWFPYGFIVPVWLWRDGWSLFGSQMFLAEKGPLARVNYGGRLRGFSG